MGRNAQQQNRPSNASSAKRDARAAPGVGAPAHSVLNQQRSLGNDGVLDAIRALQELLGVNRPRDDISASGSPEQDVQTDEALWERSLLDGVYQDSASQRSISYVLLAEHAEQDAMRRSIEVQEIEGNKRLKYPKTPAEVQGYVDDRIKAIRDAAIDKRIDAMRDPASADSDRDRDQASVAASNPASGSGGRRGPIVHVVYVEEPRPAPAVPRELELAISGNAVMFDAPSTPREGGEAIDMLVRAGYKRIHLSLSAHGDLTGTVTPDPKVARADRAIIHSKQMQYPDVEIIPYDLTYPSEAVRFYKAQAETAEGLDPYAASLHSPCWSSSCTPKDSAAYMGQEGQVWREAADLPEGEGEIWREADDGSKFGLDDPKGARSVRRPRLSAGHLAGGGFDAGMGALSIYGGLHEENSALAAFELTGGAMQVAGSGLTIAGGLRRSASLLSVGGKASVIGQILTVPVAVADGVRDFNSADPSRQLLGAEKLVGAIPLIGTPAAALAAYQEYVVNPAAERFLDTALRNVGEVTGWPMFTVNAGTVR